MLLAVLLLASFGVTAFASEEQTEVMDDMGMTVAFPAEYGALLGCLEPWRGRS